jgi:hypothetical protein
VLIIKQGFVQGALVWLFGVLLTIAFTRCATRSARRGVMRAIRLLLPCPPCSSLPPASATPAAAAAR